MEWITKRRRQILGFAAFGIMAGAAYAVAFALLTRQFGWAVFPSSLLAFVVASPISYVGNRFVSFKSTNVVGPELIRFLTVQLANLLLTSGIVDLASRWLALSTVTEIIVAYVSAPIVSFFMFELWVYRQSSRAPISDFNQTPSHQNPESSP